MKNLIIVVALVGSLGSAKAQIVTTAKTDGSRLAVGSTAPPIETQDAEGIVRSVEALKGKKNLLLTFFPHCFTNRCAIHLASLRDSYADLQKADIDVWAVSVDSAEGEKGQKAFAKALNLPFPLIPDPKRQICLLYGTVQTPDQMAKRMSVLIDKKGIVRWIDLQIDPATHGADVLKRWKAEQARDERPNG